MFVLVSVACARCSDEEVLLAVCTSDFGKRALLNSAGLFLNRDQALWGVPDAY